jgi:hypothetical protein
MAAQGQTFFLCSFDGGAAPGGTNFGAADWNYLTDVGGTELNMTNNGSGWQAEQVWDYQFAQGASTGGYDLNMPIPDYQKGVNMTAVGGSTSYRNIPDVAMVADNIEVVYTIVNSTNGAIIQTNYITAAGGTSAAAPLWAAFTSLVNQQARAMGRPPMGFLNPAIYEIGLGSNYHNCFHDITVGNNTNAASDNLFFAAPGYDLCTGWGSPNGANLINALVGYTGPVFVDFNYTGGVQNGAFYTPFPTLAQGVGAVSNNGTIFIETAGSSPETINIDKPMKITAMNGTATIGN